MTEYTTFPESSEKKPINKHQRIILQYAMNSIASKNNDFVCLAVKYSYLGFWYTIIDMLRGFSADRRDLVNSIDNALGKAGTVDAWVLYNEHFEYVSVNMREYRIQWIMKILERGYI